MDLRPVDLRPVDLRPVDLRPVDLRPPLLHPPNLPAELVPILGEASLAAAMQHGARLISRAAQADFTGLFLIDDQEAREAFWSRAPAEIPVAFQAACRRAVEVALKEGEKAAALTLGAIGAPLVGAPLVRLGLAGGSARTAACLAAESTETNGETTAQIDALLTLLAWRVAAHQEATRSQALRIQYQRWFNTLDEQLRVLDRERQKFAAMVHRTDARVFVTDLSRTIGWTNTCMGAPPRPESGTTWIGLSCRDVCSSFAGRREPDECDSCPVTEALETNLVVHREFRQSDTCGMRDLYLSALPIKGPDGRPHEAMVMIQDLSDLDILRRSESRYRLLFERSAKAIVVVEPGSRRILLANPMASRMTGYSGDELHALTLESLYLDTEWPLLKEEYLKAFASGTLSPHECRIRTHDGAERQAVVSGTRYDLEGQQAMMLEFQDTTEAKEAAAALETAELRLRAVVAHAPIVLFALDGDGNITLSEGKRLEAWGLKPSEVVGKSAFELYRGIPAIQENVRKALAGEEVSVVVQIGDLAFETCFAPLRSARGEVTGAIGVATDVTERQRLEERLRHSQRMEAIGRLAGGVAHDFNNLLAAVLGHSEILLTRLEPGDRARRNADEIRKAAERGALFTRRLLAFSRKEVLAPVVLDFNAVLLSMEGMLRRLIGEDIELVTTPAPSLALVKADCGQLEQVIMNLVVNARDAMPRGGRLTVEVTCVDIDQDAQHHSGVAVGSYVMVAVSDTGCGMDAETLAQVFEPFFTTKTRDKGTGLGLATVHGIVEQSGGHVRVKSEPGTGTIFRIYWPRMEEVGVTIHTRRTSTPVGTTDLVHAGNETVLLVEDEESVRTMISELLTEKGYTVLEAHHGVHALEVTAAHAGPIDLLVTDVVMPQMGGGELAQRIAALQPSVRVLFISGYTDDAIVRHGVRERGTAFLQKPFSLDVFLRRVREVLDTKESFAA